jgi:hypothetical protein
MPNVTRLSENLLNVTKSNVNLLSVKMLNES